MKIQTQYKRPLSVLLIITLLHLCWLTSYGWAEMVTTDAVAPSQTEIQNLRQRLIALLNREDVAGQLQQHGLSKAEALARINSLTDDEVAALVNEIDQLPNGGFVQVFVLLFYGGLAALGLSVYLLGVFFRGLNCLSDCEVKGGLKYIFVPPEKKEVPKSDEEEPYEDEPDEDYTFSNEDGY